jgi:hypothetical protein
MAMQDVKWYFTSTLPYSHTLILVFCGSSSVGRATAFQAVGRGFEPRLPLLPAIALAKAGLNRQSSAKAGFICQIVTDGGSFSAIATSRCSSVVEHFLGKEEVKSSILFNGSFGIEWLKGEK